jgi:signal transduction histidine kinase
MAAHVTHEVRNPLSSIALNVELLEEELASESAETRALLQAIQREVKRLTQTTEEYLGVARAPKPTLQPEDIAELTRDAVQFVRPEMDSCHVSLDLNIPDDLPPVALDDSQFRQVLLNLLKNAREAMPDGGAIHVALAPVDNGVQLTLRDTGQGMDAETQARLFDLFYTTKKRGTGLGLPLTQQIVLAHGGQIRCDSEVGKGTTFQVWFPSAHVAGANAPTTSAINTAP